MSTRALSIPTDVGTPDGTFRFVFGVSVGTIAAGSTALAWTVSRGELATVYLTLLAAFTVGTIAGGVAAGRVAGFAERLGKHPRNWLACAVPAVAFVGLTVADLALSPSPGGAAVAGTVFAALTAAMAFVVVAMARTRYAALVVDDEPAASWTWRNSAPLEPAQLFDLGLACLGVFLISTGSILGYFFLFQGALMFLARSNRVENRWGEVYSRPTLSVHEAGVRIDGLWRSWVVPWSSIAGVRLTDTELVLERRRWLDVRCDRSVIADPERVRSAIERTRPI